MSFFVLDAAAEMFFAETIRPVAAEVDARQVLDALVPVVLRRNEPERTAVACAEAFAVQFGGKNDIGSERILRHEVPASGIGGSGNET
ncbi:hypothetical protein BH23ACT9_BH23ACT9_35520 [soil metagenome]